MLRCGLAATTVFGVVSALLTGIWLTYTNQDNPAKTCDFAEHAGCVADGELLRLSWSHNISNPRHMTQLLASLATPAILTGTPFDEWSSKSWTFGSLNDQVRHLLVKQSKKPLFKYHATSQPLDEVKQFNSPADYQEVIIRGPEFFKLLQDPSFGDYYYSSGGMELLQLSSTPYSQTTLHQVTFNPHEGLGQVNYWFGGTNVTAHTHYDTSQNLHVLIHGKKKFLIFPPLSYHQLHLYPCLHQLYRQTQVNILSSSSTLPPPIVAELEPGDVLYLPPYWFHCVVTVTPSISINVWSDSATYRLMEEVFAAPIPFTEKWEENKLMQSLKMFIEELLRNLHLPETFVKEVVYSRYKLLLKQVSDSELQLLLPTVYSYCPTPSTSPHVIDPATAQHIASRALSTSKLFLEMGIKDGGRDEMVQAIREINIANYIEHLTYTLLHSAQTNLLKLPLFFRECFPSI